MTRGARAVRTEDDTAATAGRLHSVAIRLLRRARRDDTALGLSAARASALSVLVFGGPRTIGELATAEQVTPPTMTRLVSGLEAEGFVRRAADRHDRRVVSVAATAKGQRRLEAGRRRRVEHVLALIGRLGTGELATLDRAVEILERALEADSAWHRPHDANPTRRSHRSRSSTASRTDPD